MTNQRRDSEDGNESTDRPSFRGQPVFKGDFDEDDDDDGAESRPSFEGQEVTRYITDEDDT